MPASARWSLFQYDLNKTENLEESLNQFWDSQQAAALAEDKGRARWGEKAGVASADERRGGDAVVRGTADSWNSGEADGDRRAFSITPRTGI